MRVRLLERDDRTLVPSARERDRDRRRSPCLSRMDREESRDLTLDEELRPLLLRLLSEDDFFDEAHLTKKTKKMNVDAKPRIHPK